MEFSNSDDYPYGDGEDGLASTRELVLVVLEQLSISYGKLNRLPEAEPLLDRLMALALKPARPAKS